MRSKNLSFLLAGFTVVAVSVGITISQFFSPIGAQSEEKSIPQDLIVGDEKPVVWQRKEIPLNLSGSILNIDLNAVSPEKDWILGVKTVGDDGTQKMYAGIVTWEESSEKMKGFLRASKIDNFPQNNLDLQLGKTKVSDAWGTNQTLVLYVEKKATTQLIFEQNVLSQVLAGSEKSFSVYNGVKSSVKIDGPGSLLNNLHIRKVRKELEKSGASVTVKGMEEKK